MGRGDKRTAKGKRFKGSFGNSRPHKAPTTAAAKAGAAKAGKAEGAEAKPKAKAKPKAAAKKKED